MGGQNMIRGEHNHGAIHVAVVIRHHPQDVHRLAPRELRRMAMLLA